MFRTRAAVIALCVFAFFSFGIASTHAAASLSSLLRGRILLQVQHSGEAWYVNPADQKRYYMGRPDDAYSLMHTLGVGITNANLFKIPIADANLTTSIDTDGDGLSDAVETSMNTNIYMQDTDGDGFTDKQEILGGYEPWSRKAMNWDSNVARANAGKIFLQVESRGEAWYINPVDLKRYYLGKGVDAYNVMRSLGLGVTNDSLDQIPVGYLYNIQPYPNPSYPTNPPAQSQADLYFSTVSIGQAPAARTASIRLIINNGGYFAAPASTITIKSSFQANQYVTVPYISGGSQATQDTIISCPQTPGTYALTFVLDENGVVTESNKQNNTFTSNLVCTSNTTISQPDLSISNIYTSSNYPYPGNAVSLTLREYNAGDYAGAHTVRLRDLQNRTVFSGQVPGIETGRTYDITGSWVCPDNGTYYFEAQADASGNIAEANENNNTRGVTIACGDVNAPTVSSTNPQNGANNVARDTQISIQFSEPMNPSTIDGSTIKVFGPNNTQIAGSMWYNGTTAIFYPSSQLVGDTSYTVTVTTGVRDRTNIPMAASYTWTFRTAPSLATKWYVRMYNTDDSASAQVNSGTPFGITFGQDSGFVDISNMINASGTNRLDLRTYNNGGGYTWGFQIKRDNLTVFDESAGTQGSVGANNNDQSKPNQMVYNKTVWFTDAGVTNVQNNLQ